MSVFEKLKSKAEQVFGGAKDKVGELTGNDDVADAGRAEQVTGEVKEAGHDRTDEVGGAVNDAKDEPTG